MGDLEATIKGIGVSGTLLYVAMLLYITWRTGRLLFLQPPAISSSLKTTAANPARQEVLPHRLVLLGVARPVLLRQTKQRRGDIYFILTPSNGTVV